MIGRQVSAGWPVALSISVSTAKTYVERLDEKLEVSNRAQAIMTALQRGLIEPKT